MRDLGAVRWDFPSFGCSLNSLGQALAVNVVEVGSRIHRLHIWSLNSLGQAVNVPPGAPLSMLGGGKGGMRSVAGGEIGLLSCLFFYFCIFGLFWYFFIFVF